MAGLYLIGFAAPAFEAATCHVGETIDPVRNVPRAVFGSAAMAAIFFVILPIVWLGTLGPLALCDDLINILGPTFAPVFGMGARAAAVWFMMLNMFQGTLQPLAGASRTLSQLAEDGLLPEVVGRRSSTDCPWVATLLTAGMAILFLQTGDPPWVLAAANLTYLIGIGMPSIAVWLLRRDAPEMVRPYRAPRGTIQLGILAAIVWGLSTIFGFEQFGLPCVLAGLVLAYSGSVFYAIRWWTDRRRAGLSTPLNSLHAKLTGSMLLVLILDGAGYLLAISHVPHHQTALIAELQDIFVAVALLTITVGLVLPGMIAHAAEQVAFAADRLARGTIADLSRAMVALGAGDLKTAYARIDVQSVSVRSGDEMSQMADSFNAMQNEIVRAANGLDCAREGLREARELQLESNARYELVVDASQDGLWDWDMLTDEVYLSPRWKSILGYEDDELENTYVSWIRTIHPDDTSRIFSAVDEYLCGNTLFYEVEFRMLHKDGGYRWVLAKGKAKRNEAGVAVRLAGSHTDITARILASEGILRAKEAAESANRAKSEFLAAMSHELRTPLNAILGFSEVLQDQNFGPLNARQARYVDHMLTSGRHLLHLINNVLDHSKIEAGHMSLDLEPCNLLTMLEEARSVSNVLAQSKSVTIEVSVDDNVPVVLADEIAFRQIMYNLISNAVKFTLFGGGIFVTAKDSGDFVEISVRDTGIGLSADNLRQIWGEFEQVDSSYSRQQEGTGLGLSLSRRLVEMHGGKIWASSPGEGGGSTFILTLPRCPSDTVSEEDRNTDNLGLAA
jgi:PAS domain S-box-containing protein